MISNLKEKIKQLEKVISHFYDLIDYQIGRVPENEEFDKFIKAWDEYIKKNKPISGIEFFAYRYRGYYGENFGIGNNEALAIKLQGIEKFFNLIQAVRCAIEIINETSSYNNIIKEIGRM